MNRGLAVPMSYKMLTPAELHTEENLKLAKNVLKDEKSLLEYIFKQLDHTNDLYKISLCWLCSNYTVKKYKTIKESIDKNAKYFFEQGELIDDETISYI